MVALPHLVLVGRDGTILKTFWGVTTRREIEGVARGGGGRPISLSRSESPGIGDLRASRV